jgi:hypothetical protein
MPRFSCLALFGRRQPTENGLDPKTCEADRNAPLGMDVSGCFAELTMMWFAGRVEFVQATESHSLLGYALGVQNSARLTADSSSDAIDRAIEAGPPAVIPAPLCSTHLIPNISQQPR